MIIVLLIVLSIFCAFLFRNLALVLRCLCIAWTRLFLVLFAEWKKCCFVKMLRHDIFLLHISNLRQSFSFEDLLERLVNFTIFVCAFDIYFLKLRNCWRVLFICEIFLLYWWFFTILFHVNFNRYHDFFLPLITEPTFHNWILINIDLILCLFLHIPALFHFRLTIYMTLPAIKNIFQLLLDRHLLRNNIINIFDNKILLFFLLEHSITSK